MAPVGLSRTPFRTETMSWTSVSPENYAGAYQGLNLATCVILEDDGLVLDA
jgi:hypothetical protein